MLACHISGVDDYTKYLLSQRAWNGKKPSLKSCNFDKKKKEKSFMPMLNIFVKMCQVSVVLKRHGTRTWIHKVCNMDSLTGSLQWDLAKLKTTSWGGGEGDFINFTHTLDVTGIPVVFKCKVALKLKRSHNSFPRSSSANETTFIALSFRRRRSHYFGMPNQISRDYFQNAVIALYKKKQKKNNKIDNAELKANAANIHIYPGNRCP